MSKGGFLSIKVRFIFFRFAVFFLSKGGFHFSNKKKSDKMSCRFYYEDGQGKIVDEQENDPMDWGENADIFI